MMLFGMKRKRKVTSDTWREDDGLPSEKKAFKEENLDKEQNKIFGTWKEDKKNWDEDKSWEEDK